VPGVRLQIVVGGRAMKWPHEIVWKSPRPKAGELEENGRLLRRAILLLVCLHFSRNTRKKEECSWDYTKLFFEMCNGPAIPVIEGKYKFTKDVIELGYLAPKSVLVRRDQSARSQWSEIESLDASSSQRLCKPLRSSGGRGIYLAPSSSAAIEFCDHTGVPYLIQTAVPPVQGDFRYVFQRTPEDLRRGLPPSLRIVVERIGPRVQGDGRRSVEQLIDSLPRSKKDKARLKIAAQDYIPAKGEVVELVGSGNLTYPKWARIPNAEKLDRLDSVLTRFLADYERYVLRNSLAVFCADIGLTSHGDVVFYEFQLPFVSPYFYNLDGVSNRKATRKRLWRLMQESGIAARELAAP